MHLKLKIRKRQTPVGCRYSKDIQKELFDDVATLHPDMQELVNNSTVDHDESQEPSISLYLNIGRNDSPVVINNEQYAEGEYLILHMFYSEINLAELQGFVIRTQEKLNNKEDIDTWSK